MKNLIRKARLKLAKKLDPRRVDTVAVEHIDTDALVDELRGRCSSSLIALYGLPAKDYNTCISIAGGQLECVYLHGKLGSDLIRSTLSMQG